MKVKFYDFLPVQVILHQTFRASILNQRVVAIAIILRYQMLSNIFIAWIDTWTRILLVTESKFTIQNQGRVFIII